MDGGNAYERRRSYQAKVALNRCLAHTAANDPRDTVDVPQPHLTDGVPIPPLDVVVELS
jgi:hypothetical protein